MKSLVKWNQLVAWCAALTLCVPCVCVASLVRACLVNSHQSSGSGPGFGGPIARKNQSVRLFSRCEHRKKDDIHHWKMIFPLNNCRFGRLSSYHPSTLEFQITTRNPLVPTVGWRVPVLLILLPLFAFTAVTGRFVQPPFNCLIDGYGKVGSSQCASGSCSESLKTNNIQVMFHSWAIRSTFPWKRSTKMNTLLFCSEVCCCVTWRSLGCLLDIYIYRGWIILPSYVGIILNHYMDPIIQQPAFHGKYLSFFFSCCHLGVSWSFVQWHFA